MSEEWGAGREPGRSGEALALGPRKLGKPWVHGGISASDFSSKMILWPRVEDGQRAEGGSMEKRQEAVGVTLGLMVGVQRK